MSLSYEEEDGSESPTAPKPADANDAWEGVCLLPQSFWNLFFAFLVLFGTVGQRVALPIWFASVPNPDDNSLDPLFVLTFAGLFFTVVVAAFWLGDVWNEETNFEEARYYLKWPYLQRYAMVGASNGIGGVMLVFSAARCAPFFQAILGTSNILWTIVLRALYLKQYPSLKQSFYAVLVFVGLFLASVPSVFGMESGDAFKTEGHGVWLLLWPLIFAMAYIPFAWMNVVGEEVLKDMGGSQTLLTDREVRQRLRSAGNGHSDLLTLDECEVFPTDDDFFTMKDLAKLQRHARSFEQRKRRPKLSTVSSLVGDPFAITDSNVNVWYYLLCTSIFQELLFVLLFWVDFLPTFGATDDAWSFHQIWKNQRQDWRWLFGLDGASVTCTIRALVFVVSYAVTNLGYALMLRYTDGATWIALIGSVVTPAGGIFWLLCTLDDNKFEFHPQWHTWCIFIFAGLFVMCPSIYYYDKACETPEEDEKETMAIKGLINEELGFDDVF